MIKQRPLYHVLQKPFRGIIEPNRILNGERMASAESPRGRRLARRVAMGAIAPPPKSESSTYNFQVNQAFDV